MCTLRILSTNLQKTFRFHEQTKNLFNRAHKCAGKIHNLPLFFVI